jgi:hypothetical protein
LTITAIDNWFALASIARICGLMGGNVVAGSFFILSLRIEGGINGQNPTRCDTRQDGRYNNITTPIGLLTILEHRHVNIAHCSTTAA